MSLTTFELGYGKTATVELDVFTRILNNQIYDTEEMRVEKPINYLFGYEYVAIALSGADTDKPIWACVRRTWLDNHVTRIQYKSDVTWDFKSIGW